MSYMSEILVHGVNLNRLGKGETNDDTRTGERTIEGTNWYLFQLGYPYTVKLLFWLNFKAKK